MTQTTVLRDQTLQVPLLKKLVVLPYLFPRAVAQVVLHIGAHSTVALGPSAHQIQKVRKTHGCYLVEGLGLLPGFRFEIRSLHSNCLRFPIFMESVVGLLVPTFNTGASGTHSVLGHGVSFTSLGSGRGTKAFGVCPRVVLLSVPNKITGLERSVLLSGIHRMIALVTVIIGHFAIMCCC